MSKIFRENDVAFQENPEGFIIYRSRMKCLECNTVLESTFRHDYVTCKCPNQAMLDGGHSYVRSGAKDLSKLEYMTEYVPKGTFLWGVLNRKTGLHRKRMLSELEDSHIQNIDLHIRERIENDTTGFLHESNLRILNDHIRPELERRGLEPVDEEIPWEAE